MQPADSRVGRLAACCLFAIEYDRSSTKERIHILEQPCGCGDGEVLGPQRVILAGKTTQSLHVAARSPATRRSYSKSICKI